MIMLLLRENIHLAPRNFRVIIGRVKNHLRICWKHDWNIIINIMEIIMEA